MNEWHFHAQYRISVNLDIVADSYEEAKEIAERCEHCIGIGFSEKSAFADNIPYGVNGMTVNSGGKILNLECEEYDGEE